MRQKNITVRNKKSVAVGKKIVNKSTSAKKINKSINERWGCVQKTAKYKRAVVREACSETSKKIEIEVLDGLLLNLNFRNREKPMSVQRRILRRIVEKRQAQANHKKIGRSDDLSSLRITISCTSECLANINRKRYAA